MLVKICYLAFIQIKHFLILGYQEITSLQNQCYLNTCKIKYSKELIKKGFTLFIENQINQFENLNEVSLHFVGSVGFYLQENLKTVLESKGLKIGKVIKKPIDGLVSYHQSIV